MPIKVVVFLHFQATPFFPPHAPFFVSFVVHWLRNQRRAAPCMWRGTLASSTPSPLPHFFTPQNLHFALPNPPHFFRIVFVTHFSALDWWHRGLSKRKQPEILSPPISCTYHSWIFREAPLMTRKLLPVSPWNLWRKRFASTPTRWVFVCKKHLFHFWTNPTYSFTCFRFSFVLSKILMCCCKVRVSEFSRDERK